MGVTAAILANHELVAQGIIDVAWRVGSLDASPITLTSFALSLLLVFRTNSSYGRALPPVLRRIPTRASAGTPSCDARVWR